MRLDHLAVAAETLDEGVAWVEDRLGVPMVAGGTHTRFGTHNKLLGLADDLYLEVISPDPSASCDGPRWFDLDRFSGPPRLANWICEPEDFDRFLRHGMREIPMTRGDLSWDMGVPADGTLPLGGGFPTVLQWHSDTPPGKRLPASGCGLLHLTVRHPDAEKIKAELAPEFDDPRVKFEDAPSVSLHAEFQTPQGRVHL